ncbi:MAG: MMPL family transporter [Clostridiales bacterium]|nr:MMPL family transporter [Clostridiales bacterium]
MKRKDGFMIKLSTLIVDKRNFIYIFFAFFLAFAFLGMSKMNVINDITQYLPDTTETRQGLNIMDEEFMTYGTAKVMISNITYENGEALAEQIKRIDNIKDVEYENDDEHYKNSAALLEVTFADDGETEDSIEAKENIKKLLSEYDMYMSTDVGSEEEDAAELDKQMVKILSLAAVIICLVLLFTSQTYAEIIVYIIVFVVAAILNTGTNYLFGDISFITKSVAVVLQLALAIDYAIILAHRFAEEKENYPGDARQAIIVALSKAIVEISSSSLTTISGLVALTLMKLRIGMDLGRILSKGIVFSLITVFLLMPGLLLQMNGFIERTKHKNFVPSIVLWGRFVVKTRYVVPVIFLVIAAAGVVINNKIQFAFDTDSVRATIQTEKSIARDKINDNFGISSQMAVVIPKGDHDSEAAILERVGQLDRVTDAKGLANVSIEQNGHEHTLTEKLTPREISEFVDIDYDTICLLYQVYGLKNEEYGAFFNNIDDCKLTLIDMIHFVKEEMDKEVINFDRETTDDFNEIYDDLIDAEKQLEGENYARLVFEYKGEVEGQESYDFLEQVREITEEYYDDPIISSKTTASYDLYSSFGEDNKRISLLTIVFVFMILVFTFSSFGLPVLLVMTIQGSIWINFSFPVIQNVKMYFLSYLVVSSIQMGATIDYAIVIANRYESLKKVMGSKKAAIKAVDDAFPTIITSGSILSMAGLLIGFMSTDAIISSLGICLGRGTIISMILVMLVLPQILMLCEKLVDKTYFKL